MDNQHVTRDERTVAIENAICRLACTILMFGVLLSATLRAWLLNQACWDLLGLVALSSGVATFYQARHRTLAPRWFRVAILLLVTGAVAGLISIALPLLLR